ncbi:MAG: ATP-binding protein [Gemmatimonadota bacterium]|nr:ATP-binding protein [Gemmatimonadota bacterium]
MQIDERDQQIADLRDRLSKLSEASLRINESLEFDAVLQEVLDSARSLTGGRYGLMVLLDDEGRVQDCKTSGLSRIQSRRLWLRPERHKLFEHFTHIREPLRLRNLHSYLRSEGLPEFRPEIPLSPSPSALATPIRYRGQSVGTFSLCEKGGEDTFTAADEETLVMFASQAAPVIANARRHRDEQKARLDLETLIDTSPVGVVVFDARSGAPLTFNREARRLVGALLTPGHPEEQLLEVMKFRRADGREVSLEESQLAELLGSGETVRAEEIVLFVPDGRSVTTLVNATPIRSRDGDIESVVVTIQDMTPLEDLERLRAEFLGMVSHELRVPLTSIKGSTTALLDDGSMLDPAEARQFYRIIDQQADRMRDLISDLLDVARIETGSLAITPEPADVGEIVDEARNTFLRGGDARAIEINLAPDLPWVMVDRRRIVQVLDNLLFNAARYSDASSPIRLGAVREDFHVHISVADEGKGLTEDLLPQLFRKFSRVDSNNDERVTQGTGLGLAICKGIVEAHGGRVWAESDGPGQGTKVTFTVPVAEEIPSSAVRTPARSGRQARDTESHSGTILAVDDDPQTLRSVREILTRAGYAAIVTGDPGEVAELIESREPRLVLLDLVLPGTDGFELMKDILEIDRIPVIFLSGYGQEENIERAFALGASDYIVKPFSPTELVVRIKAALRKEPGPLRKDIDEPCVLQDLTVNFEERSVTVGGRRVELTAHEYELLYELCVNPGRVVTHDALLRRIWGRRRGVDLRRVRTLVKRLRRKLGDDADEPRYIFTEHGVGYRIGNQEGTETASTKA